MNIQRAKEEIVNTVRAYLEKDEAGSYRIAPIRQRPVLLIGPPGIGKTAIMEQAARECKVAFAAYTMTHHTRQSAMGLPFISQKTFQGVPYSVTEYTMSEIIASVYEKMEQTGVREGILFIDEINCVSETLTPIMLQFLQGKMFGNTKVPEGWVIVAAGNPPEYNRSVREFDVVTLDRVKTITVEADYDVWREYARKQGIHGAITAYLDARRDNFYKIETTVDGRNFVTARGWEDLSELLYAYERLSLRVDSDIVGEYLCDPVISVDFANYLSLYYIYEKTYNMDDILAGKQQEQIYRRLMDSPFDEKVSVVSLLLARLNSRFMEYAVADRVTDGVFAVLKSWKSKLEQYNATPSSVFSELIQEQASAFAKKKAAGFLDREEEKAEAKIAIQLKEMSEYLAQSGETDKEKAFELVRVRFAVLADGREKLIQSTEAALENAFAFMEKAFSGSPQMVLFTTELAAGYYSMNFIEHNGCDAFYQHNNSPFRSVYARGR